MKESMTKKIVPWLRKIGIFVAGAVVVITGVILMPLPGPGLLIVIAGLMILATEFAWAERHLSRVKDYAKRTADAAKKRLRK